MRISNKLSLINISLVIIPLLFVTSLFMVNIRHSLESEIFNTLTVAKTLKVNQIESFFSHIKDTIQVIKNITELKIDLPIIDTDKRTESIYLDSIKNINKEFELFQAIHGEDSVFLINTTGKIIYVSNKVYESLYLDRFIPGFTEEEFMKVKMKDIFSNIFTIIEVKGPSEGMLYVGGINDNQGRFIGAVALLINVEEIFKIMRDNTGLGKTGETILVKKKSNNEISFFSPLLNLSNKGVEPVKIGSKVAIPAQEAVQGKTGIGFSVDYRGEKVLSAWEYLPMLDWGMVAKVDIEEVYAPIKKIQKLMLFITAMIIFFVAIIAVGIARSISGPINKLHKGTEIIGLGNLDYKVGMNLNDEIGDLSRSFDEMVNRIKNIIASRDDLDKVKRELERSNKELEQFAYVASHDLKSPLRAIESLSLWIKEDLEASLTEQSRKYLDLLCQRVNRMEKLLDDLLEYSRIGRVRYDIREIDLRELVQSIWEMLNAGESFHIEINNTLPVFSTAVTPLSKVLRNLINNAIKHHDNPQGEIIVSGNDSGDWYEFKVEDDGPGIPVEFHERIFGMFQTLKPRDEVEGSGIGLAVVKKTIEQLGGKVFLKNRNPRGTSIRFTWPKRII